MPVESYKLYPAREEAEIMRRIHTHNSDVTKELGRLAEEASQSPGMLKGYLNEAKGKSKREAEEIDFRHSQRVTERLDEHIQAAKEQMAIDQSKPLEPHLKLVK